MQEKKQITKKSLTSGELKIRISEQMKKLQRIDRNLQKNSMLGFLFYQTRKEEESTYRAIKRLEERRG